MKYQQELGWKLELLWCSYNHRKCTRVDFLNNHMGPPPPKLCSLTESKVVHKIWACSPISSNNVSC